MKNTTILTAVMGTYNRVERLKETLPIYLSTKRKDIKILILNDCSTDKTQEFVESYMKKDERVDLINQKKNKHTFLNYLDGFKQVNSPYSMWVSDDDYMIGDYFDKCIEIFEKYPSVGLIANKTNKIDANSINDYNLYKAGDEAVRNIFMQGESHPGVAFRTSAINFNDFGNSEGNFGNNIYPIDRMNLIIAKNHDIVVCRRHGMTEMDLGRDGKKLINEKIVFQRRTDDYNIGELSLNKYELLESDLFNEYCFKKTKWIFSAVVKNISNDQYTNFLNKVSKTPLSRYHFLFLLRLLFFRFKIKIIFLILKNFLDISLFKRHFNTLKFLFKKVLKKFKII